MFYQVAAAVDERPLATTTAATGTKPNKRSNEQNKSRTIAIECRVRETEASRRERIMNITVNHALSSN